MNVTCTRRILVGLALVFAASGHEAWARAALPKPVKLGASRAAVSEVMPYEVYYGVYVGGQKVGWMRSAYQRGATPTLSYELDAQVRGMGRTSPISIKETRAFDGKTHALREVTFVQTSDAGEVRVEGKADRGQMQVVTTAGGAAHKSHVACNETLADALAGPLLALRAPKVGDEVTSQHFDPQSQKMGHVVLHVDSVDARTLAGVPTTTYKVTTRYPEMGVSEQSVLDRTGQVLTTQMGGFFEAKLEPVAVAKEPHALEDVLVQAVVASPKPIAHPERIETLRLSMKGFEEAPPPASSRQTVRREGDVWQLVLRRDANVDHVPYPAPKVTAAEPQEVGDARGPTAFMQSTAPKIKAAAREAVRGATTQTQAIEGLVRYVRSHLRAEYVPAFSNALEALETGRGDCTEHSVLFAALARAAGIPARVAVGVAYWPPGQGFGWHAWCEVYADGRWLSVDPTWGQTISDPTHIKLAEGTPEQQARVVMLLGRLKVTEASWTP